VYNIPPESANNSTINSRFEKGIVETPIAKTPIINAVVYTPSKIILFEVE
jgi:hypothetical protein